MKIVVAVIKTNEEGDLHRTTVAVTVIGYRVNRSVCHFGVFAQLGCDGITPLD